MTARSVEFGSFTLDLDRLSAPTSFSSKASGPKVDIQFWVEGLLSR
jgi:hypothetical protein